MTVTGGDFTRLQRILLNNDGTVTHILEAYAGEPIEVVNLVQSCCRGVAAEHPELGLADGETILDRRVVLRGRESCRNLLVAEAVVVVSRAPHSFVDALLNSTTAIGVLLAERRIETCRELLRVETSAAGSRGTHFGIPPEDRVISRTYLILAGAQPMILITESFPATYFRELSG